MARCWFVNRCIPKPDVEELKHNFLMWKMYQAPSMSRYAGHRSPDKRLHPENREAGPQRIHASLSCTRWLYRRPPTKWLKTKKDAPSRVAPNTIIRGLATVVARPPRHSNRSIGPRADCALKLKCFLEMELEDTWDRSALWPRLLPVGVQKQLLVELE